jgi:hypothetical protein
LSHPLVNLHVHVGLNRRLDLLNEVIRFERLDLPGFLAAGPLNELRESGTRCLCRVEVIRKTKRVNLLSRHCYTMAVYGDLPQIR